MMLCFSKSAECFCEGGRNQFCSVKMAVVYISRFHVRARYAYFALMRAVRMGGGREVILRITARIKLSDGELGVEGW